MSDLIGLVRSSKIWKTGSLVQPCETGLTWKGKKGEQNVDSSLNPVEARENKISENEAPARRFGFTRLWIH